MIGDDLDTTPRAVITACKHFFWRVLESPLIVLMTNNDTQGKILTRVLLPQCVCKNTLEKMSRDAIVETVVMPVNGVVSIWP